MLRALPFALGFLLPLGVLAGTARGGWWTFEAAVWIFGVIPAIDQLVGLDTTNPDRRREAALAESCACRLIPWAWVPVQLALLAWGLDAVTRPRPLVEQAGITVSVGLTCGAIGITFAHELCHRASRVERALAELLMLTVSYPHFVIEHVHGHHRRVATPADPATARAGESFYAFYPRSVLGGVRSAWALEIARLARRGRRWRDPRNRLLAYAALLAIIYAAVFAQWWWIGVAFFAAQGLVAFSMLEVINYVEHYGLRRRELGPGRYEPVAPHHSWNSSHRVGNWFLLNLARHSDHHWQAGRRYPLLRHVDAAPQLPAGYALMFVLALVPPLWFRVMDPRVEAWAARHGAPVPAAGRTAATPPP